MIAGIAWIGSSFYFVHLDANLKRRAALPEGASGECRHEVRAPAV